MNNTVTVSLRIIGDKSNEFLQSVRSLQGKLKQEEGFAKCSLYQDVDDQNTFHLIEEWKTQDDLDRHLKSEIFRVLLGVLKVLSTEAEIKYHLSSAKLGALMAET